MAKVAQEKAAEQASLDKATKLIEKKKKQEDAKVATIARKENQVKLKQAREEKQAGKQAAKVAKQAAQDPKPHKPAPAAAPAVAPTTAPPRKQPKGTGCTTIPNNLKYNLLTSVYFFGSSYKHNSPSAPRGITAPRSTRTLKMAMQSVQ